MAFGDFAAGMGNTAIGMQQGEMVRNQIRAQNQQAEQHASMIRQQQEIEAFNRQARQNVGDATRDMQFNPGQLPQVTGAGQYTPQAPEVPEVQPNGYAQDIGREGRGRGAPAINQYASELEMYRNLRKSEQARLDDIARKAPNGDVNRSTAKIVADGKARVSGYDQGIANYESAGQYPAGEDRVVPQGRGQKVTLGRSAEDHAANFATEQRLQGSNVEELKKEIARAKDPATRRVLEAELAAEMNGSRATQQYAQAPQQGQPQAPQQTATGPVQMFSGPDIDQTMARAQQQYNMLQMQLRNTFDHNQKMQIADKMQSLQFEVQDAQLQKLSHVALQDDNALNQMVGLFTRGTGAMGVQHLPDGSVQLVRPDGQPISGVMSRQELAYNLYNGLSDSQRRKNAEIANVRALEQAKAGGKAAGEDPYNQALEAQKGQNSLNVARTYANADMLKADMANATKMMEVGSPVSLPDGSVVMKMPGGVQFVRPPVETVMPNGKKKMMSQPQPEFIPHAAAAATARQAGMPVITGGAIFNGG